MRPSDPLALRACPTNVRALTADHVRVPAAAAFAVDEFVDALSDMRSKFAPTFSMKDPVHCLLLSCLLTLLTLLTHLLISPPSNLTPHALSGREGGGA